MSRTTIRFVYFDLDDTLLDHGAAEKGALRDLHERHEPLLNGLSFEQMLDTYQRINRRIWRDYSDGKLTKLEAKTGRFVQLAEAISLTDSDIILRLPDDYLDLYGNHWTPIPGAFDAYRQVAAHVDIGILTNGFAEIQTKKLERFPVLAEHAEHVVISEEVGHMKPSREIFQHAAELAGAEPNEILYIGDSFRSDVRGGIAAGWRVAWYRGDAERAPESFCFSDWSELTTFITKSLPD